MTPSWKNVAREAPVQVDLSRRRPRPGPEGNPASRKQQVLSGGKGPGSSAPVVRGRGAVRYQAKGPKSVTGSDQMADGQGEPSGVESTYSGAGSTLGVVVPPAASSGDTTGVLDSGTGSTSEQTSAAPAPALSASDTSGERGEVLDETPDCVKPKSDLRRFGAEVLLHCW